MTPLGKVVETGQEHTGRWTKEEHDAFLTALQLYGKEWKKVAARVKTRTVVQTRTHAQKYFQKLQRVMEVSLCLCVVVILFALIDCSANHTASFCRRWFIEGTISSLQCSVTCSKTNFAFSCSTTFSKGQVKEILGSVDLGSH